MKQKMNNNADIELVAKAKKAMKEAVSRVIEDHKRTGDPIVIWQDGKVVKVPPDQLSVKESQAEYTVKKRKTRKR